MYTKDERHEKEVIYNDIKKKRENNNKQETNKNKRYTSSKRKSNFFRYNNFLSLMGEYNHMTYESHVNRKQEKDVA